MTAPPDPAVIVAACLTEATAALCHVRRIAGAKPKGYPPESRLRDIAAVADAALDRLDDRRKELCEGVR
jgi:hypothetical protein